MGSRLLNGSPQLSLRVTIPLILTVTMSSATTLGTIPGTPAIKLLQLNYCNLQHLRT